MIFIVYSSPTLAKKIRQPKAPPDAPKVPGGGISRSDCSLNNYHITFTPIIPESLWGYTTSQTPVVWVYVSYTKNPEMSLSGELSLLDTKGNLVQEPRITVNIPNTSGAFPLTLPNLPKADTKYQWTLEVNCGDKQFIDVGGYIYQKQSSNLNKLTPEAKISFYEEKEIWYDAVNEYAKIYCRNPRYWQEFLQEEKFQSIVTEPFKCSQ